MCALEWVSTVRNLFLTLHRSETFLVFLAKLDLIIFEISTLQAILLTLGYSLCFMKPSYVRTWAWVSTWSEIFCTVWPTLHRLSETFLVFLAKLDHQIIFEISTLQAILLTPCFVVVVSCVCVCVCVCVRARSLARVCVFKLECGFYWLRSVQNFRFYFGFSGLSCGLV